MSTLSNEASAANSADIAFAGDSSDEDDTSKARALHQDDELLFPMSKGAFSQYWEDEETPRELRVYYRDKEIAFDDPAFYSFGETLTKQSRFRAGDALQWGDYEWPKVRQMLEDLIEADVLKYADEVTDVPAALRHEERETLLMPAKIEHGKTWDDAEEIMTMISGTPLETGYIELVIPIFRVAHMYMDADDRQVGEANVFPPAMRLDRPTLWRTCTYSGTRYQPDLPMNVTALRIMRNQWRHMMVIVRRISDAYRARFPEVDERGWTVGDIERMAVCVLALPTYQVMRVENRVENGKLHPALSSAFRLTDGLRMLMHHMLFVPFHEPTRSGTTPMTGREAHEYAERNFSFHTGQGVCAGPPSMVDDFLAVVLDREDPKGGWPDEIDPEVQAALDEVDRALDYGLLGLQNFGSVFSLFPTSTAGHAQLREIITGWKKSDSPSLARLRDRCEKIHEVTQDVGWLKSDEFRKSRLIAYNEMYQKCGFGVDGRYPDPSLEDQYEDLPPLSEATMAELKSVFARHFNDLADGEELFASLAEWLGRFISFVQVALRVSLATQDRINTLLGREKPKQTFMGRDLAKYIGLDKSVDSKDERKEVPFLIDDIAKVLGVTIDVTADDVTITDGVRNMPGAPREIPLDEPSAG
ncbi:MAG: hypothetical protein QOJ91_184 [Sphingomonadales bacterium]|jgi:hypothetical protein|nr:hypothetical protein [Sphingomonadales bacterium]